MHHRRAPSSSPEGERIRFLGFNPVSVAIGVGEMVLDLNVASPGDSGTSNSSVLNVGDEDSCSARNFCFKRPLSADGGGDEVEGDVEEDGRGLVTRQLFPPLEVQDGPQLSSRCRPLRRRLGRRIWWTSALVRLTSHCRWSQMHCIATGEEEQARAAVMELAVPGGSLSTGGLGDGSPTFGIVGSRSIWEVLTCPC